MLNDKENIIDFGNKKVKKIEKQNLVDNVFNSVAGKYDLMNDLTSLGVHRLWKDALINWMAPQPHQKLADIAGGTGDISIKFLLAGGLSAHVIDINKEMIKKVNLNILIIKIYPGQLQVQKVYQLKIVLMKEHLWDLASEI